MYNPFNLQTNRTKKRNPFDLGGEQNETTNPQFSFQVSPVKTGFSQSTPQTTTRGTFDAIKSAGSYLFKPTELEVRRPFTEEPIKKTVPRAVAGLATIGRDVLEAIPRAAVTLLEEADSFGRTQTKTLTPNMAKLYGDKEYKNISGDIQSRLINGDGILSAYTGAISQKTLDVVFGAQIAATGFKALASVLGKGGDIAVIEAYKTLGSPATEAELNSNYRALANQLHPDITGGDDSAIKILNKAKATLDERGLPTASSLARNKAEQYAEVLGRETNLGEPIFGINAQLKQVYPEALNLPALPGYVSEFGETVPVGMSSKRVKPVGFADEPFQDTGELSSTIPPKLEDISDGSNPLYKEAKKYKSAEDFVRAQPKNKLGFNSLDESYKLPKLGNTTEPVKVYRGGGKGDLRLGDFVTTDKARASTYGKVQEFDIPKNQLVISDPEATKLNIQTKNDFIFDNRSQLADIWNKANKPDIIGETKPITAFKKTPIDEMVDFDISIPEAQKILRELFDEQEMSFTTTKNLIEGNAIGRFSTKFLNLIKLVESGGKVPSSTLYHEAFHGYFNVFIPEAERKAILAKVRKNIATLPARVASAAEGYKGADVQAEEWLADDFAKYVKEISAGKKPKSLFADLWKRVLDKIRSWIRKTGKFDELYQDILAKKRTGFEEKPGRTEVRFNKLDVEELRIQKEILEESIKSNPARQLAKYANQNGELPEVLGGVSGKFGSSGDDIVTELGFKDSEEARAAYQVYRKQLTRLDELKGLIKETNLKETPPQLNFQETPLRGSSAQSAEVPLSELAKETPANQLQEVQELYKSDTPYHKIIIDTSTPVKQKVGLIDYLRTPDRVLKKIGLENVSAALRKGYDKYLYELPKHIDMITDWSKQVPKESNVKIFRWLDGKEIELNETELRVAKEIKEYLGMWAERLNLPEDNQISHYITHIFDIGTKQKEFDEDIAKLIKNKVPGSVYDPFLEKRLGAKGYVEDTWRALDAYVKRGVRKANMDPALEMMKKASERLEDSQLSYVKRLGDRINMRPTEWDNLLDNTIKQIVGYKFGQRPTAVISGTLRRMVYRGALGLNINSAIKNLTQGVNTFSKLGARDTLIGYINLLKPGSSKELEEVGVLAESFIQDRTLSSTKQLLQKADKGLFVMFQTVEKINRGSAYFGAKAKAIRQGLSEEKAIQYAKKVVRDTQFVFGSIDTPVAMQGDIAKLLFQFGSFSQKQTEFLAEMAKNKEYAGIIRYILASMFVVYTAGQVFDIKGKDFNPLNYFARFGKPPALALPIAVLKAVLNIPNQYGQTPSTKAKIKDIVYAGTSLIPGGVQISKTLKGNTIGKKKPVEKKSSNNPFSR